VNTSKPDGLKRPTAPCKGSSGSWMIPSGNLPSGFQITLLARNMRDSRSRSSCPCWKTLLGERSMTSEARAITKRGACAREASSSSLRACFVMLCGSPAWQEEQDRRSFLWIRMLYFFRGATRRAL
jgi:hypothetical protein